MATKKNTQTLQESVARLENELGKAQRLLSESQQHHADLKAKHEQLCHAQDFEGAKNEKDIDATRAAIEAAQVDTQRATALAAELSARLESATLALDAENAVAEHAEQLRTMKTLQAAEKNAAEELHTLAQEIADGVFGLVDTEKQIGKAWGRLKRLAGEYELTHPKAEWRQRYAFKHSLIDGYIDAARKEESGENVIVINE